jgi:hypothetical protein
VFRMYAVKALRKFEVIISSFKEATEGQIQYEDCLGLHQLIIELMLHNKLMRMNFKLILISYATSRPSL